MPPSSNTRRSKRTAVRVFVLLFVAIVVGFYLTVGPDVVDLSGVRSLFIIPAVLLLIVALFFVK
jgi:high-affinity Fe2+/Pb2+ permease